MYLIIDPAVMSICDCATRRRGAFGERIFGGKQYEWEGGGVSYFQRWRMDWKCI